MRLLLNILIIGSLLVSCVQQDGPEQKANTEDREASQSDSNQTSGAQVRDDHKFPTSEDEQLATHDKQEKKTPEEERLDLIESTKRIIQRNQAIPSIRVDSGNIRFGQRKNFYFEPSCDHGEYKLLNQFSVELNDSFRMSSNNTGKNDGKVFCLRRLEGLNEGHSVIVFARNEGGHTSDETALITVNDKDKHLFYLPLSYYSGWDGHETLVKSTISKNMITREIEERYGWSNEHPDSLNKQPRRVVVQEIMVKSNGSMELLNEDVFKYNMDELFE